MLLRFKLAFIGAISLLGMTGGCKLEDTNKKTAISCIVGAPVCKNVEIDKLEPKLADDVRKKLKEQEEKERLAREKEKTYKSSQTQQSIPASVPEGSADENTLVAKASLTIIAACTGWQMGTIQRPQIMDMAKVLYAKQGYNPNTVDWQRAIEVAQKLDKEKNLGCIS